MPVTSTVPGLPAGDSTLEDVTLPDLTVLRDCRPDLRNVADLWGQGWSVIPLKPKSKVPAIRWEEYQRRLPTPAELESWFTRPGFNVGIVTGAVSGIFVIDADSPAAVAWAEEELPPCDLRVRTSKGLHLYYPYSGSRRIRNKVRVEVRGEVLDIDIRGDGGYVVGPDRKSTRLNSSHT